MIIFNPVFYNNWGLFSESYFGVTKFNFSNSFIRHKVIVICKNGNKIISTYLTLIVSKLLWVFQKTCWKGLSGLHKIYRKITKKYIKNILNQNCLKIKPTPIACPISFLYAQEFKTSEVCPIFLASLFCFVKKQRKLDLQIWTSNSEFYISSWKPVYPGFAITCLW